MSECSPGFLQFMNPSTSLGVAAGKTNLFASLLKTEVRLSVCEDRVPLFSLCSPGLRIAYILTRANVVIVD